MYIYIYIYIHTHIHTHRYVQIFNIYTHTDTNTYPHTHIPIFLNKQVRLMAGTLAAVGMGLASLESVARALESPSEFPPEAAPSPIHAAPVGVVGPTMPAQWLCLERVEYALCHPRQKNMCT